MKGHGTSRPDGSGDPPETGVPRREGGKAPVLEASPEMNKGRKGGTEIGPSAPVGDFALIRGQVPQPPPGLDRARTPSMAGRATRSTGTKPPSDLWLDQNDSTGLWVDE